MKKVLNRGLNFCVLPLTLNITNVLVEYRKYERSVKWVEFFADKDTENDSDTETMWKKEIFPKEKSNLPPNSSSAVKTFLNSVKSEVTGTIYNKTKSNISKAERDALAQLVKLQRNCVIVIKPCDKGAVIIICDYEKYITSCEKELSSTTKNGNKYYKPIPQTDFVEAQKAINATLKTALDTQHISKNKSDAMTATDKTPGKF
jgi:hypothetical protein